MTRRIGLVVLVRRSLVPDFIELCPDEECCQVQYAWGSISCHGLLLTLCLEHMKVLFDAFRCLSRLAFRPQTVAHRQIIVVKTNIGY